MATERQAPDSIAAQTGWSGAVTQIDEDPDAPGGDWVTAPDNNTTCDMRVTFPTPSGNLTTGAGLQEFKVYVRQFDGGQGGTPTCTIDLYENGSLVTSGSATDVTSATGQVISFTWDAAALTNADGSGVEALVTGTKSGGSPANRNAVDIDAIEWNVDYQTASNVDIEVPVGSYAYTGQAPTVTEAINVAVPVGSYAYSGLAPSVLQDINLEVPAAGYAYTGQAPTVLQDINITVPLATYAYTGQAPEAIIGSVIEVPAGSYAYTGNAPSLTLDVPVPAGSYAFTGYAPSLAEDATVEVPAGSYAFTGYAPTVDAGANETIEVPVGSYAYTGLAPSVLQDINIGIPLGTYSFTGYAPTVLIPSDTDIEIPVGAYAFTGQVPTAQIVRHYVIDIDWTWYRANR